jgi:hypothetical protein
MRAKSVITSVSFNEGVTTGYTQADRSIALQCQTDIKAEWPCDPIIPDLRKLKDISKLTFRVSPMRNCASLETELVTRLRAPEPLAGLQDYSIEPLDAPRNWSRTDEFFFRPGDKAALMLRETLSRITHLAVDCAASTITIHRSKSR